MRLAIVKKGRFVRFSQNDIAKKVSGESLKQNTLKIKNKT